MAQDPIYDFFVQELRKTLRHLYSPADLRKSPLMALFTDKATKDPVYTLRKILIDSIQLLNPGPKASFDSDARRIYYALSYRYVEQTPPKIVADGLGIGVRQLQRLTQEAEQLLADTLWSRYDLSGKTQNLAELASGAPANSPLEEEPAVSKPMTPERDQELQWLKESFPSEVVNIAEVIATLRRTLKPLIQAANVQVEWRLQEDVPPVTGQATPIRQALLNLLMAAVSSAPGGKVQVDVASGAQGIEIQMQAARGTGAPADAPQPDLSEYLQMARQFAGLVNGALEVSQKDEPGRAFCARFALPFADQVTVLVIDDNIDTLRLLQRYLSGTRYHFLGASSPDQALALIESQRPHIIVMDVMLPGIDDWELLGRFREHPQTRAVPIIICTILPQEELARSLGADGFLRKPVSRLTLLAGLDHQVERLLKESK